jgi:glucokinase
MAVGDSGPAGGVVAAGEVVAAVDWGGTWIRVALAAGDGELLRAVRRRRPDAVAAQCRLVADLVAELGEEAGQPTVALGVGIAGITRRGVVESASNIGIRRPFPLAGRLRELTGRRTVVVNDTQAAALGEAAVAGPGTSVLLTVGTGIGGAIVADGRLVTGAGAAGDFGHMVVALDGPVCACGGRGCLEQVVSGRTLDQVASRLAESGTSPWLARQAGGRGRVHAGDLERAAAEHGDGAARQALEQAAAALVAGLRSITAAADPDLIVLGGGLLGPGLLLTGLVQRRWAAERPSWTKAELRLAAFGPDAGLRGAALLAARAGQGPQY